MAVTAGIGIGGILGAGAALDAGDLFRYLGTAVFLAITVRLYIWKFHLAKRR